MTTLPPEGAPVSVPIATRGLTRRCLLGAGTFLGATSALIGSVAAAAAPTAAPSPRNRVLRALIESWPPYLIPGADGSMRGLDAELLQAICRQAGYELAWIRGSPQWRKRRFRELQNDQFDLIFSATPAATLASMVMYTRPYRNEAFMLAAAERSDGRPDPRLQGVRGFEDVLRRRLTLLHVDAFSLGADFESWRPRLAEAGLLVPYQTTRQGVDMLRLGRAPLILGDDLDLHAQARALNLRLVRQPFGASVQPVCLMVSRRRLDESDVGRLDRAIHALEQRGDLAAIRKRHGAS